jgi:hypothetical protein
MLIVWISQKVAIQKLKIKKIKNKKITYYKNKNFKEEVWLDDNLNPHFLSTQFKGINIDFGDSLAFGLSEENILYKNEKEIEKIYNQISEINKKMNNHKLPFSIKIERPKK